jgi:hypothetical protein
VDIGILASRRWVVCAILAGLMTLALTCLAIQTGKQDYWLCVGLGVLVTLGCWFDDRCP